MYHISKIELVDDNGNRYTFDILKESVTSIDGLLPEQDRVPLLFGLGLFTGSGLKALSEIPIVSSILDV